VQIKLKDERSFTTLKTILAIVLFVIAFTVGVLLPSLLFKGITK